MPSRLDGNTVLVYLMPTTTTSPTSNLVSTGSNITYPTDLSFAFYTDNCSGGNNNVATGMYMIVVQNAAGCISQSTFVCITSGSSGTPPPLTSNALSLNLPIYPSTTSITGTGTTSGDILRLYVNGLYQQSIQATGNSFTFSGLSLTASDQIKIYSQTGTSCMTQSSTFTVSCFIQPPIITRNSSGNLITGATSIAGTSALPGASVQVYKGTAPSGVATGAATIVTASGNWSVAVPALSAAENYYAVQTYGGCTSAASASASVLTASPCPTISNTYSDASTSVSGTMASTFTGTIRLYQDGALIGSQAISSSTTWNIPVAAGTLYYNGILSTTAQATGNTESSGCATKTVGCTSPITPAGSPSTTTITEGQAVTYTVSNTASGNWYALLDANGVSYATSIYKTNSTGFNFTTKTFTTPGTYDLRLSADALSGCPPSFVALRVIVNAVLPVDFVSVHAFESGSDISVVWNVANEQDVAYYEVERSHDGTYFEAVGKVDYKASQTDVNGYVFIDKNSVTSMTRLYYRVRQIDLDGTHHYSPTVQVNINQQQKLSIKVYPNPVLQEASLLIVSDRKTIENISIIDAYGRICYKLGEHSLNKGITIIRLDKLYHLTKGVYRGLVTAAHGTSSCTIVSK